MLLTTQWTPQAVTALIVAFTSLLGGVGAFIAVLHGQTISHNKMDTVTSTVNDIATAVEPTPTPTTTTTTAQRIPPS